LIGCEIIAIDGTKSRAHNSKKANFNQKKIERHLVYIEERTQEYLAELAKMIYRIIALQSLRLQKNRAIKKE
jgi:predicted house-cleaning noncanonical NTP pyrophosphatase (MazG superfamily)